MARESTEAGVTWADIHRWQVEIMKDDGLVATFEIVPGPRGTKHSFAIVGRLYAMVAGVEEETVTTMWYPGKGRHDVTAAMVFGALTQALNLYDTDPWKWTTQTRRRHLPQPWGEECS